MTRLPRIWRSGAAITFTLASLMVIAAAPVAASVPLPDHGAVVKCKYITKDDIDWAFTAPLKEIVVLPPEMLANGTTRQTVGWRFVVKRLMEWSDDPAWKVTYRSPVQTGLATATQAADFETMRVDVAVPRDEDDHWRSGLRYTVTLQMLWYRADGSVQAKESYLMPSYYAYVNGHLWDQRAWGMAESCPGAEWAAI